MVLTVPARLVWNSIQTSSAQCLNGLFLIMETWELATMEIPDQAIYLNLLMLFK